MVFEGLEDWFSEAQPIDGEELPFLYVRTERSTSPDDALERALGGGWVGFFGLVGGGKGNHRKLPMEGWVNPLGLGRLRSF